MRISINMRPLSFLVIALFLVSTLSITTSFAQEPQLTRLYYPAEVTGFAYSPDDTTVAVIYEDGKVRIWDAEIGEVRHTFEHPNVNSVSDIAYSPDGTTVATADDDWKVRLWDVATGVLKDTLIGHTGTVVSVAYSPDGGTLASASGFPQDQIRLWDVATGTLINVFGSGFFTRNIAYNPNGTTLAATASFSVRIWDAATGGLLHTLSDGSIFAFAYSPDGTTLAAGGNGNAVSLWDAATGTHLHRLIGHTDFVTSVAYSPDSRTIASGSADSSVRLWDVATGRLTNILPTPAHVHDVVYSPDGTTLASTSVGVSGRLRIWDATTGTHLHTLGEGSPTASIHSGKDSVLYSSDGTVIAHWPGILGTINLWRLTPPPPPILFTPGEVADQTFTVGTPVNLTLPFATGGTDPYTYTLTPIPNGLQFDATTRELYGTPLTPMNATPVTYTATDATGRTTDLTFTITVLDAPITFLPNVIADQMFVVNVPITPLYLPQAIGGTPPYRYILVPPIAGLLFDPAAQLLTGTPTTVGTTAVTYGVGDATGASATLNFTIEVIEDGPGALDVNGDGVVNVLDLVLVAVFYGMTGHGLPADVNADNVVDVQDLIEVAAGIDAAGGLPLAAVEQALLVAAAQAGDIEAAAGAPMGFGAREAVVSESIVARNVAAALSDVKQLAVGDVRLGKELGVLSELLALLAELTAMPETTALLPNYPNPFNPETWFPYQLAKAADVTLRIYDMRGVSVRELVLGHQSAGVYRSRGRAAYWDGRNASGESVASGVYFYTLIAGDFTATRKMLIRK